MGKYDMTPEEAARIANNFTYHPPHGDQASRYELIRNSAKSFAQLLGENILQSREKSLALTALEECVMWANAAIARTETTKENNNG